MSNSELDKLYDEQQKTFERKQAARREMQRRHEEMQQLYNASQVAWNKRVVACDELNQEFQNMRDNNASDDRAWDDYRRIRDFNNTQINSLKSQADDAYHSMINAFERASSAYECGDRSLASSYTAEGRNCQAIMRSLNAAIKSLGAEVKSARARTESMTDNPDNGSFSDAKERFQSIKAEHETAREKFRSAKAAFNRAKRKFEAAEAAHSHAQETLRNFITTGK